MVFLLTGLFGFCIGLSGPGGSVIPLVGHELMRPLLNIGSSQTLHVVPPGSPIAGDRDGKRYYIYLTPENFLRLNEDPLVPLKDLFLWR